MAARGAMDATYTNGPSDTFVMGVSVPCLTTVIVGACGFGNTCMENVEDALLSPAALVSVTVSVDVAGELSPAAAPALKVSVFTPLAVTPDAAPAAMLPLKISHL